MPSEPTAEQVELRRKGRQRLIGAVVLALVAVVFVPMLLDPEPRRERVEPLLAIPPKDGAPPLVAAPKAPEPALPPRVGEGRCRGCSGTRSRAATGACAFPGSRKDHRAQGPGIQVGRAQARRGSDFTAAKTRAEGLRFPRRSCRASPCRSAHSRTKRSSRRPARRSPPLAFPITPSGSTAHSGRAHSPSRGTVPHTRGGRQGRDPAQARRARRARGAAALRRLRPPAQSPFVGATRRHNRRQSAYTIAGSRAPS